MNSLRLILVLSLVGLSFTACDFMEQEDRTYTDDPKIEFLPVSETVGESEMTGADSTITFNVQLIGSHRDSDLPVSFTVADSSTAEEGTHYSLNSTSTTIPANSSNTEVSVDVLNNDQDDGEENFELFLILQDSEEAGVEVAENYNTFTLTIRGADE